MAMAGEEQVYYVNPAEAIKDEIGGLPAEFTTDGLHFKGEYYNKWIDMSLHFELGSSLRRMVQTEHTVRFRTDGFALLLQAYLLLAHGGLRLYLRLLLLFRSRFRYGSLRLHLSRTGGSRSLLFG